eukprot:3691439-Karenia_brevis.AAC.1
MSYYSVEMQKSALHKNYKSLRCNDGQFPKCSKCGQQPGTAPNSRHAPKTIEDVRAFKCTACLYPPCSGCKAEMSKMERRTHGGKDSWT